jgi:hypothetical protein
MVGKYGHYDLGRPMTIPKNSQTNEQTKKQTRHSVLKKKPKKRRPVFVGRVVAIVVD